jgi:hypothetical protein
VQQLVEQRQGLGGQHRLAFQAKELQIIEVVIDDIVYRAHRGFEDSQPLFLDL